MAENFTRSRAKVKKMPVNGSKTSVNGSYVLKAWFMHFFAKKRLDREDFYAIKPGFDAFSGER